MANCHLLFTQFNQVIRLNEERRHALMTARDDLRLRIVNVYNNDKDRPSLVNGLEFQTQGSFIMDTIINPLSENYDLDFGVYFLGTASRTQRPPAKQFHDFVKRSIETDQY